VTHKDHSLDAGVYTIPPGSDFARDLAQGIWASFASSEDPLVLASVTVLVPTRRAVTALRDAFMHLSGGSPLILPSIRPIGDVDEEALIFEPGLQEHLDIGSRINPPISPLKRQMILSRLISAWASARVDTADSEEDLLLVLSPAQSLALASDLGRFLDNIARDEITLAGLSDLVPGEFAVHWQRTTKFLDIITEHWPEILEEAAATNPAAHRSLIIRQQAQGWRASPPQNPIFVAGSTGSIPATADLIAAVCGLPQGFVVLPGLDQQADDQAWKAVEDSHPQFGMKELLENLQCERDDVELWPFGVSEEDDRNLRAQVVQQSQRPAETSEGWQTSELRRAAPEAMQEAFGGLSVIEAAEPGEEAQVIALAMRHALEEPGKTAALVTPDRNLSRRVAAHLLRWGVSVDDSAGLPLDQTPPGTFLQLIFTCIDEDFAPVPLLALLKHPLCTLGRTRPMVRELAARLEIAVLRGPRSEPGLANMVRRLQKLKETKGCITLIEDLKRAFEPMDQGMEAQAPNDVFCTLIETAENLAQGENQETGEARLWSGDAGEAMQRFLTDLFGEAGSLIVPSAADYPAVFAELMAGRVVRPRFGAYPRAFIWGPLEARLQRTDTLILGGLNEKSWPAEVKPDPWLSRPMAARLGLSQPERRIGQSAHDFVQLICAPKVIVTRSLKQDGAPTVPSRWLMRLENMLKGFGHEGLLARGDPYLEWARAMDAPRLYAPLKEPEPRPPVEARPRQISVTEVERWIRDPYGLYARRILSLEPLDPIDADASAMDRGNIIHNALEAFIDEYPIDLPDMPLDRLIEIGRKTFEAQSAQPDIWLFWWPRFEAIADWFIKREQSRRPGTMPLAWEVRGQMSFEAPAGPFTLTAKADRFDRFEDGRAGLYDYKTGTAPTNKLVSSGLAPQLPLEALMVGEGGFEGIAKPDLCEVAFLELKGGDPAGKTVLVTEDLNELILRTQEGLRARIALFDDADTPYRSRVRPMFDAQVGPYDHLARVKEWSVYGQED
jgi:ATP-dependent helicase/nuclease subunit B